MLVLADQPGNSEGRQVLNVRNWILVEKHGTSTQQGGKCEREFSQSYILSGTHRLIILDPLSEETCFYWSS